MFPKCGVVGYRISIIRLSNATNPQPPYQQTDIREYQARMRVVVTCFLLRLFYCSGFFFCVPFFPLFPGDANSMALTFLAFFFSSRSCVLCVSFVTMCCLALSAPLCWPSLRTISLFPFLSRSIATRVLRIMAMACSMR